MIHPPFRIKSLMIAVALAGIAYWTVSMPGPGFLAILALAVSLLFFGGKSSANPAAPPGPQEFPGPGTG